RFEASGLRKPTPSAEISDIRWVDPLAPGDLAMTRGLEAVLARAARLVAGAAA
ncbi:MAG: hypothetical protein ACK4YX_11090, partial [Rhabdaerophilum calidifontis]